MDNGNVWTRMTDEQIIWCEKVGVYEVYKQTEKTITYYSFYYGEGFYKVVKDFESGAEHRTLLKAQRTPKHLLSPEGHPLYNYCTG